MPIKINNINLNLKILLAFISFFIVFGLVCLCVSLKDSQTYWKVQQSGYNIHEVGSLCAEYAQAHEGHFPINLRQVVGTNNLSLFISPLSGRMPGKINDIDKWSDYKLVTNKIATETNDVLLYYFTEKYDRGTMYFIDGHVKSDCNEADYKKYIFRDM